MLFVDSTDPSEIASIYAWGVASGVTTNPLIYARESKGAELEGRIRAIVAASHGPVSVELVCEEESAMVAEAETYHAWAPGRICIKVPFSETGLRVTKKLKERNMMCNVTCMMSFNQAYLASLAGADFVSIFSGRVRDIGYDVRPIIRDTRAQIERESLETKVLVGSIRHLMDVNEALKAGAHIVTVTVPILHKMLHHPKTDEAIQQFNDAWKKRDQS